MPHSDPAPDIRALDAHPLVPRLLHDVHEADARTELLGRSLASPIVPRLAGAASAGGAGGRLALRPAGEVLGRPDPAAAADAVALLAPAPMGRLVPETRRLAALGVAGIALDLTALGDAEPFGATEWRPRTREDLAELRAAAGVPLWLLGVLSPADAEVAAEAGLEGIVVHRGAAARLGGPAALDALPEVLDAVAGMIGVHAGGPVRDGIDVFRYLAVGAEAVVVESDRSLAALEAELRYAMRLTGCGTLADVGYEAIFAPLFHEL